MSNDTSDEWPAPARTSWLSPWMVRRQDRIRLENFGWLAIAGLCAGIGLLDENWLWLPIATIGVRGALVALMWTRVWWTRRRVGDNGEVILLTAVPREAFGRRPSAQNAVGGDSQLISGYLEVGTMRCRWRPAQPSAGDPVPVDLPVWSILSATWCRMHDPLMTPSAFLRIQALDGGWFEFLVWDYLRLPPWEPLGNGPPYGNAVPG